MENASKALMIAGAIILVLLLISFGLFLVTQSEGLFDRGVDKLDELTISSFNSPIEKYEGKNNGTAIKTLLTDLNTTNLKLTREDNYAERGIGITINDGDNEIEVEPKVEYTSTVSKTVTSARSKINTGKTYTVEIDYDTTTGLVSNVIINVTSTSS